MRALSRLGRPALLSAGSSAATCVELREGQSAERDGYTRSRRYRTDSRADFLNSRSGAARRWLICGRAKSAPSLIPERLRRIDGSRAAGRKIGCKKCDRQQESDYQEVGGRVGRLHTVEQA